jgi:L-ascorbate metabolism protein UlaG (beta-lactamase superfamily)
MIFWLGHASFFVQLSGIRILIDPVFGKLPVGKRFSELPVDPEKFLNIDYILISHAHYDHCDKKSLQLLSANNPKAVIRCCLKPDKLIRKWINNPIETAGWYPQFQAFVFKQFRGCSFSKPDRSVIRMDFFYICTCQQLKRAVNQLRYRITKVTLSRN